MRFLDAVADLTAMANRPVLTEYGGAVLDILDRPDGNSADQVTRPGGSLSQ